MSVGRTHPEHSQNEAFSNIEVPNTSGDLHILIGLFGLYSKLLYLYELDIRLWR